MPNLAIINVMSPNLDVPGLSASSRHSTGNGHLLDALSPVMKGVEAIVGELAHSSVPVLLIGERGTGKRTIARRIHLASSQLPADFRILSCSELDSSALAASLTTVGATAYLQEI